MADTGCSDRHIVLIGLMGAGKSSVGRALAKTLGRPLFDSDELVEAQTGRTVRDIWRAQGEAAFRELETEALVAALDSPVPSVIAAAGGVVLSPFNRAALQESDAHVVWLLATVDVLVQRVENGVHRPLLDDDPEATLRAMFAAREPLYREVADAVVSVDHRSVHEVAQAVMRCTG